MQLWGGERNGGTSSSLALQVSPGGCSAKQLHHTMMLDAAQHKHWPARTWSTCGVIDTLPEIKDQHQLRIVVEANPSFTVDERIGRTL